MDGKLRLPMERMNEFFARHKGQRVIVKVEAVEHGSTKAQISYYYSYIVPTIRIAWRDLGELYTDKEVDRELLNLYPGDKTESNIGLGEEVSEARHLTRGQMSDYIDWLKCFAAENLNVYIEEARSI